jgi:hypothetical protein
MSVCAARLPPDVLQHTSTNMHNKITPLAHRVCMPAVMALTPVSASPCSLHVRAEQAPSRLAM